MATELLQNLQRTPGGAKGESTMEGFSSLAKDCPDGPKETANEKKPNLHVPVRYINYLANLVLNDPSPVVMNQDRFL